MIHSKFYGQGKVTDKFIYKRILVIMKVAFDTEKKCCYEMKVEGRVCLISFEKFNINFCQQNVRDRGI